MKLFGSNEEIRKRTRSGLLKKKPDAQAKSKQFVHLQVTFTNPSSDGSNVFTLKEGTQTGEIK